MIKIKNIFFKYDKDFVLKDISCNISSQDFVAIIGPNGAGKSTLLKCLSNYLVPQKGKILLKNSSLQEYNKLDLAKQIAVVVQQPLFEFDFLVKNVILMGRSPYLSYWQTYKAEDIENTNKIISELNITNLAGRKLSELSGGEFQLVMIARALNQDTDILLFDEPATHLDIHHQIKIFSILKNLNQTKNKTIIAISHNVNLAAEFCNKIVVLSQGTIVDFGTISDVIKSDNLSKIFNTSINVIKNPFTKKPTVLYNYNP